MALQLVQLLRLMRGNRLKYAAAIIAVGISIFLSLVTPFIIKISVDSVIGDHEIDAPKFVQNIFYNAGGKQYFLENIWTIGALIVAVAAVSGLFTFIRSGLSALASEKIALTIRDNLFSHLQKLPYRYHVKAATGDLIQRCTSDVETIRRFLASQFVELGRCVFLVIMSVSVMLSLNVKLTLLSCLVLPIVLLFTVIYFSQVHKVFKLADEKEGELSAVLQENLSGVRVVKAFGRQAFEVDKFDKKSSGFRDLIKKLINMLAAFWSLSDLLCLAQMGIVLFVGIYWTVEGRITLGTFILFNAYIGMLLFPVRQLGRILSDMGKTFVSVTRINEILNEPLEDFHEDGLQPELNGDIEISGLDFSYDKKHPILKNTTLKIKGGQTVAILGHTGAGKSTLMHLLLRLYKYKKGSIKISGVELNDINKLWLRKNIGIVLQEPFLYSKTIRANIKMAKHDATDEEVFDSCRIACVHDVIEEFENGYDTIVGEKGVTLSGGQKQRVAIARTLIKDSSVLIFDDSLSAVDTETDSSIRAALKKRSKNVTTIIISHRITTLAEADHIFVMENGTITDEGTHEELSTRDGLYKRIWNIQNALQDEMM